MNERHKCKERHRKGETGIRSGGGKERQKYQDIGIMRDKGNESQR
jgi:hypothetical protein